MNNRRAKKINTKRVENILAIIEADGWHVIKREFEEGLFFDKKSVCHFKIKELPDYIFGIWLCQIGKEKEYDHEFVIFGQYEKWVDKLKPARNEVSADTTLESFLEGIKFVYKNQDRFATDSYIWENELDINGKLLMKQGWLIEDWSPEFAKKTFDNWESDEEEKRIKNLEWFHKLYRLVSRDLFKEFPFINAVGMIDRGKDFNPRYELGINVSDCNQDNLWEVQGYVRHIFNPSSNWRECASYWDCGVTPCYFWKTKNKCSRKDVKQFKKHYDFNFLFTRERR